MAYRQITSAERYTIAALRKEGFNLSRIARHLRRHRSTISREVRRNAARHDGAYRAHGAIERTSARRSHSRRNQRFSRTELARVEALLERKWSPEQIANRLRVDFPEPEKPIRAICLPASRLNEISSSSCVSLFILNPRFFASIFWPNSRRNLL